MASPGFHSGFLLFCTATEDLNYITFSNLRARYIHFTDKETEAQNIIAWVHLRNLQILERRFDSRNAWLSVWTSTPLEPSSAKGTGNVRSKSAIASFARVTFSLQTVKMVTYWLDSGLCTIRTQSPSSKEYYNQMWNRDGLVKRNERQIFLKKKLRKDN